MAFAPTGTPFPNLASYPELGSMQPGDTVAASSGTVAWNVVGYTEGGAQVGHPQTVVELRADQVTAPIKAIRSEDGLEISFNLVSLTPDNYRFAMNRAFEASSDQIKLYRGGSQVQTLSMVLFNPHLSPLGDFPIAYEVPACFENSTPQAGFTKDNMAMLSVSFHAIADPDRATEDDAFGQLNVGSS